MAALTRRVGAQPREVQVRDLGCRWGFRGRRKVLYFHWRVAMLPPRMIDYVVAHELVHLLERTDSDAFWERQQWLREHGGADEQWKSPRTVVRGKRGRAGESGRQDPSRGRTGCV